MFHVKSTPHKVFMASFKQLKIYCLEIHAASVRSSLMSCLSCFCSVKLSGSLLPPHRALDTGQFRFWSKFKIPFLCSEMALLDHLGYFMPHLKN